MGAGIRMPLRVLLPCLAVSLVAFGAVAAGIACASRTSGYLMRQADNNLLACASSMLSRGSVAAPGSGPVSGQRRAHGSTRLCPASKNSAVICPYPATSAAASPSCRAREVTGSCQSSVDTRP
jgi:hypothetical protein